MQTTVYLTVFEIDNNVRIGPEKVNTRSFSPAMPDPAMLAAYFRAQNLLKVLRIGEFSGSP
jgi:hypothetical protein